MDYLRERVIEAINESREATIQKLKFIIDYPFHPETKFILLEINGYSGIFSVTVTQMNDWDEQLFENAFGEPDDDLPTFSFDVTSKINMSFWEMKEQGLFGEIDSVAKEYFVPFFTDCFKKAGGKQSLIPFYLYFYSSGRTFDLNQERWIYE